MDQFKRAYSESYTWRDLENAILKHLNKEKAQKIVDAMIIVADSTGLDMRQDFTLRVIQRMLETNMIKD